MTSPWGNLGSLAEVTRDNDGRYRVHTRSGLSLTLTAAEWHEAMTRIVALAKEPVDEAASIEARADAGADEPA